MAVEGSTGSASEDATAPLLAAVEHARAAVDLLRAHLGADTVWHSTDRDVLHAVHQVAQVRAGLEEVHLRLVREVDSRGVATASPVATTPEGFLRSACLVTPGQARRDVAAARATAPGATLEPFGPALADGQVTREHIDVAVRCLDSVPPALFDRPGFSEQVASYLITASVDSTPLDLSVAARHLLATVAPDPADRMDERSFERRFLDLATDATGMTVGRFQLDPVAGASLRALLERWSGPRPAGSPAPGPVPGDDRGRWGCETDGSGEPDRRQPRQRRADALAHVVQAALGIEGPHRGERPRVVVHLTPEQLVDHRRPGGRGPLGDEGSGVLGLPEVEGGGPIPTWAARALACDAVVQRVVMGPAEAPLELGRAQRLTSLTQRRALAARDGGCVVPGCTAPPQVCDVHHVRHWADGGPTDVHNLCLLCPAHHTAVHAGTWTVSVDDQGQVWVGPPPWVDRYRRPRPAWQQHARRTRRAA